MIYSFTTRTTLLVALAALTFPGCSADTPAGGPDVVKIDDVGNVGDTADATATDTATTSNDTTSNDAGQPLPQSCKSDKECIAFDAVCDKSVPGGKCVECALDGDCLGESEKCLQNICKKVDLCKSDKGCLKLGKVCNKSVGVCVDCTSAVDCDGEKLCKAFKCVAKPKVCKSSKDCITEGKVCNKSVGVCVDCLGNLDCDAGQFCADDLCTTWLCKPAATKCASDGKLQTCKDDGSAWTKTVCAGGKDCVNGTCQQTICTPGNKVCSGGKLGTCSADGTGVENLVACNKPETCVLNQCVGSTCKPGVKTCLDNKTVGTCQSNGKDYELTPCKALKVCETGACTAKVCEPGKLFCKGDSLMLCSSSGGAAEGAEDCKAKAMTCSGGKCTKVGACAPGEVVCSGDGKATKTCKADGSGFVLLACPGGWLCTESGTGSSTASTCVQLICKPNAVYCDVNEVKKCNKDGTSAAKVASCSSSKQCAQGACIPTACTAGATVCKDDLTLLTCKVGGSGYVASACPNKCAAGKCL